MLHLQAVFRLPEAARAFSSSCEESPVATWQVDVLVYQGSRCSHLQAADKALHCLLFLIGHGRGGKQVVLGKRCVSGRVHVEGENGFE